MKKKQTLLKRILVIFVLTMVLTTGFEAVAGTSLFVYEANAADTNYYMVDSVEEYASTLREALLNREEEINIILTNGTITADQAKELYFQIAGHNGNPKEGDYIEHNTSGKYIGGEWVKINNVNYYCVEYEFDFFTTAAQEREVDEAVSALWSELDLDGCSDYEKIMRVCDYLTPIIEYDQDQKMISHSAYAAIVKHSAVCQGYALLFYRLMLELGIDCRYVRGEVSTDEGMESHAWNIVKVGDVYYNVDLTWDSGFAKRGRYRCMLRNEEEFTNHNRDEAYLTEDFCRIILCLKIPIRSNRKSLFARKTELETHTSTFT